MKKEDWLITEQEA